jgi:hypothetical protein
VQALATALDVSGALTDLKPYRLCPCGREALVVGDTVRCPAHGAIPRWAVAIRGRILYPAPRKRALHRRPARHRIAARLAAPLARPEALPGRDELRSDAERRPSCTVAGSRCCDSPMASSSGARLRR